MKGLHPKRWSEVGLEDEGAHNIICGAQESFGLAILRGGVRARKPIDDAIGGEKGAKRGVDEFPTIVTLHALDDSVKLGVNVGEKALKNRGGLGLMSKRKRTRVVRVII